MKLQQSYMNIRLMLKSGSTFPSVFPSSCPFVVA